MKDTQDGPLAWLTCTLRVVKTISFNFHYFVTIKKETEEEEKEEEKEVGREKTDRQEPPNRQGYLYLPGAMQVTGILGKL